MYSGAGHRRQYGACALHAGYLRLHTKTQNMQVISFYYNNDCTKRASVLLYRYTACYVNIASRCIIQGDSKASIHGENCFFLQKNVPCVDTITLTEHTDASLPLMTNSLNTFGVTGVHAFLMRSCGWSIFCTSIWYTMTFKYPLN
jgi:hypothetical protein